MYLSRSHIKDIGVSFGLIQKILKDQVPSWNPPILGGLLCSIPQDGLRILTSATDIGCGQFNGPCTIVHVYMESPV